MQPVDDRRLSTGPVRAEHGVFAGVSVVFPGIHNAYDSYKEFTK